tara:strand:- start:3802 stop:4791 length:990 start_codon:yes stop_codon:yes gene_type:complete
MAFLDNSGTIILDAILTDIGRKRMAQGNFHPSKFALGDDEMDYTLVNVNDSDYSKLETLSTIEALNSENATINHGLQNFTSDDILYLPQIKINSLLKGAVKIKPSMPDFYFVSANDETTTKLKGLLTQKQFLESNSYDRNKLFFESGIENNKLPRNTKARERYILNYNLLDRYFIINCDHRFVDRLLIVDPEGTYFENDEANNLFYDFQALKEVTPVSLEKILKYYSSYFAIGVDNLIYSHTSAKDELHSAIKGPRGTACALNVKLIDELTIDTNGTRDYRYTKFGKLNQTLFGGSKKFDYIDTSIYIQGTSSKATLQVPIRILRYAGT